MRLKITQRGQNLDQSAATLQWRGHSLLLSTSNMADNYEEEREADLLPQYKKIQPYDCEPSAPMRADVIPASEEIQMQQMRSGETWW